MKIEFSTDSAAFKDPYTGEDDVDFRVLECKRILKQITFMVHCHYTEGSILDINGNKIGEWSL